MEISKKVLIVDDEDSVIDILESMLEDNFYSLEIEKVANGLDAFLICQKTKFDLIITDYQMPFMNGAALVVAIRTKENQNKGTSVVMLSGYLDKELKEKLNPQKVEFLGKPFEEEELVNMVSPSLID